MSKIIRADHHDIVERMDSGRIHEIPIGHVVRFRDQHGNFISITASKEGGLDLHANQPLSFTVRYSNRVTVDFA